MAVAPPVKCAFGARRLQSRRWIVEPARSPFDAPTRFDTFARTSNAGYTLVNLSAKVQLLPALSLAVRADNVFDQQYQTANGYRQPGASGYATLRYQFGF